MNEDKQSNMDEEQSMDETQPKDETQPEAEASPADEFEELQTAPPKEKIKLSWVGKTSTAIVAIWVIIAFAGPFVAPFHEADMIADDSFLPADGQFWLGSDYIGRDTFSRIMWGARTTIGISFVSTLAAYFVGITVHQRSMSLGQ